MIKPKALKPGDTIGIIAPAGPVRDKSNIDPALEIICKLGFKVKEGKHIRDTYGYLAGKDSDRLSDLHEMFADETVDGILCLKGGYGTPRIAGGVDVELIRRNPKIFAGFSDITTLHILLNQQAGLITFHAPMPVSSMIEDCGSFTMDSFIKSLTFAEPLGELKNPPEFRRECLSGGKVTAPTIGGNLTLIGLTMGTPYEIDTNGKILFMEDIRTEPYQVDGILCQLRNSGKLQQCAGIIIGDWNDPTPYTTNPSLNMDEVIRDLIVPLGIPVISGFRAGHCEPTLTVPLGAMVTLDADNGTVTVEESCLS